MKINAIGAILIFLLSPDYLFAQDPIIAVVKSKDIPPYELALNGITKILGEKVKSNGLKIFTLNEKNVRETIEKMQLRKPDVILTLGTLATKAISEHIKDIPIVFSMVLNPEESDLKANNVTGSTLDISYKTQLKHMKQVLPSVKKIGVIYNVEENEDRIRIAEREVGSFGFILKKFPINSLQDMPDLHNMDIDVLWLIPDKLVCNQAIIKNILITGLKHRVPIFGLSLPYAKAGALMALSCDYEDIGGQTGEIALKILNGARPANISITKPRKVKLYLNLSVAERIGQSIPKSVIEEAEEVF